MCNWKHILPLVCLAVLLRAPVCAFSQKPLASKEDYKKYIEPLLKEKDFGTHYVEDGAADASVLTPTERSPTFHLDRPSDAVIELVRLGAKSVPLLIDCLGDGRLTSVRFDGNTITKAMNVPVGYVCLDIMTGSVRGKPVSDMPCGSDGLGACMNNGFYFRPDDYWKCREKDRCEPRPWVTVVQGNWRLQFLQNRLRFQNFYDSTNIPEYKEFTIPKK